MSDARPATDWQAGLGALAGVLREVHRALIEVEGRNFGPISGPFQMLNLTATHPHFAWLRPLSGLIVTLDQRLAGEDRPGAASAREFRAQVEGLVGPGDPANSQFRTRYAALLQQSPELTMAHGALRRALEALSAPKTA